MAHDDDLYPPVPLTDDERRERGAQLAAMIRTLLVLERDHATLRKEQNEERHALKIQIRQLANSLWRA